MSISHYILLRSIRKPNVIITAISSLLLCFPIYAFIYLKSETKAKKLYLYIVSSQALVTHSSKCILTIPEMGNRKHCCADIFIAACHNAAMRSSNIQLWTMLSYNVSNNRCMLVHPIRSLYIPL